MTSALQRAAACAIVLIATLLAPSEAAACGGLFCNSAPTQQSGEDILFSIEPDGTLTVHIQIRYVDASDSFAWILPLPSVPTAIGVGTDSLFAQLDAATRPRFELEQSREGTCRSRPMCDRPDAGSLMHVDGSVADADSPPSPGPMIHLREEVGPYDAVVLGGESADVVLTWLRDNGFDVPSVADGLIADYVAARHVFVALRLLGGRDAGEIQPLTLRYAEGQPCVPIRLTGIAATMDMPITAYFLADAFVAPTNYSLIDPDFGDARLWGRGLAYQDYVGRLVDDAGGRAFVTDYAGDVPDASVALPDIASLADTTDPASYLAALGRAGFAGDPQLFAILPRFLPVPEGQTAQAYYNCLSGRRVDSASCGYVGGFDPVGLTAAIETQIIAPRREVDAMLARHTRLTRLYTTMDPSEMSLDPLFRVDSGLPTVSNVHTATVVMVCSDDYYEGEAPTRIDLPNGTSAPWSPGTPRASGVVWCRNRGLLPPGTHAGATPPAEPTRSSSCAVSQRTTSRAALAVLALAIALAIGRRKKTTNRR